MNAIYSKSGIYGIRNKINGKIYIGMTKTSFKSRWEYHVKDLTKNQHHSSSLQKDFNTFGIKAFAFFIVEVIPNKAAIESREKYYIHKYAANHQMYNTKDMPKHK